MACVRAQVASAVTLAYGSFTNPVNSGELIAVIAGLGGTYFGLAGTIPSGAGKAISIYLQLMLAALGQFECHERNQRTFAHPRRSAGARLSLRRRSRPSPRAGNRPR